MSTLFELQGAAGGTSAALDDVLAAALGLGAAPDLGVVLPPLGRCDLPGEVAGDHVAVGGLATAGLARRDRAVVIAGAGDERVAAVVATADLDLRSVHGIDPRLGLIEVAARPGARRCPHTHPAAGRGPPRAPVPPVDAAALTGMATDDRYEMATPMEGRA